MMINICKLTDIFEEELHQDPVEVITTNRVLQRMLSRTRSTVNESAPDALPAPAPKKDRRSSAVVRTPRVSALPPFTPRKTDILEKISTPARRKSERASVTDHPILNNNRRRRSSLGPLRDREHAIYYGVNPGAFVQRSNSTGPTATPDNIVSPNSDATPVCMRIRLITYHFLTLTCYMLSIASSSGL